MRLTGGRLTRMIESDYDGPVIEWLYNCSWIPDKKIIGIQFLTKRHLIALIF